MTRPPSRVSVFQWKTWKGQKLETFCVTPKYWLCLYFEPLLFIHTKTIYKCSYFLSCIYIYITYTFICITYECIYIYEHIYVSIYMIYDNREKDFLHIVILKWIFYFGGFLSIYSTPPFKTYPTNMRSEKMVTRQLS